MPSRSSSRSVTGGYKVIASVTFFVIFFAEPERKLTCQRPVINTGHVKITATEFKAKCLSLIDQVHELGQPVFITKHGKVVASLVSQEDVDQKPWLKLHGSLRHFENPLAPAVDEHEIKALK